MDSFTKYYNKDMVLPFDITIQIIYYLLDINKILELIIDKKINCTKQLILFLKNGYIPTINIRDFILYIIKTKNIELRNIVNKYKSSFNFTFQRCTRVRSLIVNIYDNYDNNYIYIPNTCNEELDNWCNFVLSFSKLHDSNRCLPCYNLLKDTIKKKINCDLDSLMVYGLYPYDNSVKAACKYNNINILKGILKNTNLKPNNNCLDGVFKNNNIEIINLLLFQYNIIPNYNNLLHACHYDNVQHIKNILLLGNVECDEKCLQTAFKNNSTDAIELLTIEYNILPTIVMLEYACGYLEYVCGYSESYKWFGKSQTIYNTNIKNVEILINKFKLKPNTQCLTNACFARSYNIINLLIKKNVKIITGDHIIYAENNCMDDIAKLLIVKSNKQRKKSRVG
jgi:hypothetical protein